jgi:hypothetical protein
MCSPRIVPFETGHLGVLARSRLSQVSPLPPCPCRAAVSREPNASALLSNACPGDLILRPATGLSVSSSQEDRLAPGPVPCCLPTRQASYSSMTSPRRARIVMGFEIVPGTSISARINPDVRAVRRREDCLVERLPDRTKRPLGRLSLRTRSNFARVIGESPTSRTGGERRCHVTCAPSAALPSPLPLAPRNLPAGRAAPRAIHSAAGVVPAILGQRIRRAAQLVVRRHQPPPSGISARAPEPMSRTRASTSRALVVV